MMTHDRDGLSSDAAAVQIYIQAVASASTMVETTMAPRGGGLVHPVIEADKGACLGQPPSAHAWYTLFILVLIYTTHAIDRNVINVVLEPLRHDLDLSDTQLGFIGAMAHGITFALAAFPLGFLVDRVNRVRLLSGMVVLWSVTTALAGFAQSFIHVMASRMAVGAAEAGAVPTCLSIIGDRFNASRRASAVGLFFVSSSLGSGFIFVFGSLVVANYGWRAGFFVAGLPGIILAIIGFLTIREPRRGAMEVAMADQIDGLDLGRAHSVSETMRFAGRQRSYVHLVIAIVLHSALSTGFLVWLMPFLLRIHHMPTAWAGLLVGISLAVGGGTGAALSGFATDQLSRHGKVWQALVPAVTAFATFGFGLGTAFAGSTTMVVSMVVGFEIVNKAYFAPSYGLCVSLMKPGMRGFSMAGLQTLTNLVGAGGGAFVVGYLSDLYGGPESLRYAIATLVFIGVWSAGHFLLAARTLTVDLARAGTH